MAARPFKRAYEGEMPVLVHCNQQPNRNQMKLIDPLVKFATFAMVGILVLKSYHPSKVVAPMSNGQWFLQMAEPQFDQVVEESQEDLYGWTEALNALYFGEKSHERSDRGFGTVGDLNAAQGPSYGPYQISEGYWKDSMEQLKWSGEPSTVTWDSCLSCSDRCEVVIRAYMQRYASAEAGRLDTRTATLADVEKIARIHNGGPKGHTKEATVGYWQDAHESMIKRLEGDIQ